MRLRVFLSNKVVCLLEKNRKIERSTDAIVIFAENFENIAKNVISFANITLSLC